MTGNHCDDGFNDFVVEAALLLAAGDDSDVGLEAADYQLLQLNLQEMTVTFG
jgi:hypothetical protein